MNAITTDLSVVETLPDSLGGMANSEDDLRGIEGLLIALPVSFAMWAGIILSLLAIF